MRPTTEESPIRSPLGQHLIKIWPALLALPPPLHENAMYDISMIFLPSENDLIPPEVLEIMMSSD
jgi:hypothetical protein